MIRSAKVALPIWPIYTNDQLTLRMAICVQIFNHENSCTALQTGDYRVQKSKFNRLKNRINLKTTGFNPFGYYCHRGKRSIYSTHSIFGEGIQANSYPLFYRRLFTINILTNKLEVRVLTTKMIEDVRSSKNKDGINLGDFQRISKELKTGTFRFSPVRRVNILKTNNTETRPLGISKPREKIVQKAIDLVLNTIFEEKFLDCSHGSRLGCSCHSALKRLQFTVSNVSTYTFCIEKDIKDCSDNIPHATIIKGINREVDCPATLNLVRKILSAGYVLDEELKKYGKKAKVYRSRIGTPQKVVLSPLFSNIVLHELDWYVCETLNKEFHKGKNRATHNEYRPLRYKIKAEN